MKLPPFAYHRAGSLEEATSLLDEHGEDARVLGGGQSLLPLMALRMSRPELLVDITGAADLQGHVASEEQVVVSAAVTTGAAEASPEIRDAHPLLVACLGQVGHVEIRSRGTLCGSVAHADPAAEIPALLLALDGSVQVACARGRRRIAAEDFLLGPYTNALDEGELVAGVELPCPSPTSGWSVREIARRQGDFALVGVIVVLDADPDGRCTQARVALFGVAGAPVRATAAEQLLVGEPLSDGLLSEAAEHAFDGVDVLGDLHGSATYRRRAGTRLVRRSLAEAAGRLAVAHA
ncbi:FAD binding domain-containing protein [Pseudonocardia spinosispora]|uniref:FAD binding domain-containing protein n=1 Tax=Pseudonocardia spinosispora TaxID=103441 RepID=UPI000403F92F|nr:xanthine dehydrogenase family protein subunit M [Pseudonocardia spinosispora]